MRYPNVTNPISWLLLGILVFAGISHAQNLLTNEAAFRFRLESVSTEKLLLKFEIAPEYYLYKKQFVFTLQPAKNAAAIASTHIDYPADETIDDPTFGNVKIFRQNGNIVVHHPLTTINTVVLRSQGCADIGVCYPPLFTQFTLQPDGSYLSQTVPMSDSKLAAADTSDFLVPANSFANTRRYLEGNNVWFAIPLFILIGLGLAFTPCMLPMLPILSATILGNGQLKNAGWLSLSYSAGLIISFTILGITAASLGIGLGALFQHTWLITIYALFLATLGWVLLQDKTISLPHFIQAYLQNFANRHHGGNYLMLFFIGMASALLMGPCITPALAGILIYISESRNLSAGVMSLSSLGLGLCIPLMVLAFTSGRFLPRPGAWLITVKNTVAWCLFALALWVSLPLLGDRWQMLAFALLAIFTVVLMVKKRAGVSKHKYGSTAVMAGLSVLAALQLYGTYHNNLGVLAPLTPQLPFITINSLDELAAQQKIAADNQQDVVLEFYADWCIACKEIEAFTLSDKEVRATLQTYRFLKADVTANTAEHQQLLQNFRLFGPPAFIIFSPNNAPVQLIGKVSAQEMLKLLLSK